MFRKQRWEGSGRQKLSCEDWSSANGEKTQPHCPLEANVITELQIHNMTLAK